MVNAAPGVVVAGRFRLVRLLGKGGMGAVWSAVQEPLGRTVALKLIEGSLAADDVARARFEREAKAIAALRDPHVVTLYDFGFDGDTPFYAMELLDGESLRARIARLRRLPWRSTVPIIEGVAKALRAAHASGVVHRDIKPENVMLVKNADGDDVAKVLDFGIAKPRARKTSSTADSGDSSESGLTLDGGIVGTPGFIAPEVTMRGAPDDARSDLYALGVTWFEALAGAHPFSAKTAVALILAHATAPRPTLPLDVEAPLVVASLLLRLMARDPDERPQSATALVDELRALPPPIAALPPSVPTEGAPFATPSSTSTMTMTMTSPTPLPSPTTPAPTMPPPSARNRLLVVGAALMAVAVVVLGVVSHRATGPRRGGTLRVAVDDIHGSWDPHTDVISTERQLARRYLYEPLVDVVDGTAIAHAARFVVAADGRSITLRVRDGARFHVHPTCNPQGRAADAADLAATIEAQTSLLRSLELPVERVRRAGDDVVVELGAAAPSAAALAEVFLMPKDPCAAAPIGTGPFRLEAVATTADRALKLVREPSWPADIPPFVDALIFRSIPKPLDALEQFEDGQLDVFSVSLDDKGAGAVVVEKNGVVAYRGKAPATVGRVQSEIDMSSVLMLRTDRPPFHDIETRRLLNAAIDRPRYWGTLNARVALPQRLLPESVGVVQPPGPTTTSIEQARRLLRAKLGGTHLTIAFTKLQEPVEELCAQLVGVVAGCTPTHLDLKMFARASDESAIDVLVETAAYSGAETPASLLGSYVKTAASFGYDGAPASALLDKLARTADGKARLDIARDVEAKLLAELPAVPLGHAVDGPLNRIVVITRPAVRGVLHPGTLRVHSTGPDDVGIPPLGAWLEPE